MGRRRAVRGGHGAGLWRAGGSSGRAASMIRSRGACRLEAWPWRPPRGGCPAGLGDQLARPPARVAVWRTATLRPNSGNVAPGLVLVHGSSGRAVSSIVSQTCSSRAAGSLNGSSSQWLLNRISSVSPRIGSPRSFRSPISSPARRMPMLRALRLAPLLVGHLVAGQVEEADVLRCPTRGGTALEELPPLQDRLLLPDAGALADEVQELLLPLVQLPVQPGQLVVLAVGVVVPALGVRQARRRRRSSTRPRSAGAWRSGSASAARGG